MKISFFRCLIVCLSHSPLPTSEEFIGYPLRKEIYLLKFAEMIQTFDKAVLKLVEFYYIFLQKCCKISLGTYKGTPRNLFANFGFPHLFKIKKYVVKNSFFPQRGKKQIISVKFSHLIPKKKKTDSCRTIAEAFEIIYFFFNTKKIRKKAYIRPNYFFAFVFNRPRLFSFLKIIIIFLESNFAEENYANEKRTNGKSKNYHIW